MEKKMERMDYIDMSKGFAIIAVALGHIYENNFIRIWLCSFHLPLFLIVSGILIKHTGVEKRNIKDVVKSRFKRLIIPYFSFEILSIIIWMITNKQFNLETFWWNIKDTVFMYTKVGATWFLPTLFAAEVLMIMLIKLVKNSGITICLFALIYCVPFLIKSDNHCIVVLLRILTAIGFLAIGYYGYNYIIKMRVKNLHIIMLSIICMFLSYSNNIVDLYGLKFDNPIVYTFCSVIGAVSVILLFKNCKVKALQYFGNNSLIIMGTHQIILWYIINPITGIEKYGYIYGMAILAILLVIEIPIIYFINNYAFFMLGQFNRIKQPKN